MLNLGSPIKLIFNIDGDLDVEERYQLLSLYYFEPSISNILIMGLCFSQRMPRLIFNFGDNDE